MYEHDLPSRPIVTGILGVMTAMTIQQHDELLARAGKIVEDATRLRNQIFAATSYLDIGMDDSSEQLNHLSKLPDDPPKRP